MATDPLSYEIQQVMAEANATGLFVSLCTFNSLDTAQGPTGNLVGTRTPISGLTNIPCMDAPLSPGTISALEAKSLQEIEEKGMRHIILNGYYPAAVAAWQAGAQATIDGVNYEVFAVESDSQTQMTRVKAQLVTM